MSEGALAGGDRRPRLYLDIDGSICPLPPHVRDGWWSPPTDDWSEWVDPQAFNETPFPVELLDDLVSLDWVEVVWATTWPLDMIDHALTKAGYPSLLFRHLGPSGIYDKFEALRGDVERDPVPFVWIEDHFSPEQAAWRPSVPYRRIRPVSTVAVSRRSWRDATEWLRSQSGATPVVDEAVTADRASQTATVATLSESQFGVFHVPQPDDEIATLDFSVAEFGDLRIDVEVGERQGFLLARFSDEVSFFALICRQWATGRPAQVVAQIEALRSWIAAVPEEWTATTESQLLLGADDDWSSAVEDGFAPSTWEEFFDREWWSLNVECRTSGLLLSRPADHAGEVAGEVDVFVGNEHLHALVAGLIWRTRRKRAESSTISSRYSTAEYLAALDEFEYVMRHRL